MPNRTACRCIAWALTIGSLVACGTLPPIYQPPFPPPQPSDVQSIQPFLPGGRWAIVDRIATWGHRSTVHSALRQGYAVAPAPTHSISTNGSRVGILTLTSGVKINYLIHRDFSGLTRVRLRYPSGAVLSLELPEEEEDEDCDEEEDEEDC